MMTFKTIWRGLCTGRLQYMLLAILCQLFTACTSGPVNPTKTDRLPEIYPDYAGVTIPAEIAPLNFNVRDSAEVVDVVVRGSKGGELHAQGGFADFDIADWHALTAQNRGGELTFTVCTREGGQW